jgi:predicted dienelactone hydrolase
LVTAGFRVLSLDHHGNNHVDGYHPEGFLFGWERPRDITFVLDTVCGDNPPISIGVAGFSLGGYTAAALAGARLDAFMVEAVLSGAAPLPPIEELPDALDALRGARSDQSLTEVIGEASADLRDDRVDACFVVAPGMGALLTEDSLRAVSIPVAIRWGDADDTNPFDRDVRPFVEHIPGVDARSEGAGVRHHDFIALLTPDRTDVRDAVAADAAEFFAHHLTVAAGR